MSSKQATILVTAATGKLGQLVVKDLLAAKEIQASDIAIAVRDPAKVAKEVREAGVSIRTADFNDQESYNKALAGIERVLLISSNLVGGRVAQHKAVIDAAEKAGTVKLFAYTSIPKADTSTLRLAVEHKATEELIVKSGVPYVFLRNGWYIENFFGAAGTWKEHKTVLSASGKAQFSSATRAEYASAAAAVLLPSYSPANAALELGGDEPFTLDELAKVISSAWGIDIRHRSLPADDYVKLLTSIGLPADFAGVLADSDVKAESENALLVEGNDLSKLIGRPTVSLADFVKQNYPTPP